MSSPTSWAKRLIQSTTSTLTRVAQIPLHHKLVDLETMLTTGILPYGDTPAASDVFFYDYLGVDGLADPLTRVIGQDTCVLRLTALNQFLLGLGMAPVKNTRECHPIDIAAYLRSMDPTKNDLAKKYHDMCMQRIRDNMPNNVVNERGRLHRCDLCTKSYHIPDMLIAHKVREHGGEEWKCDECSMILSTKTSLRLHKFNIHSGEVTCEECNRSFENYRVYFAHKVVFHQCQEIECPWADCNERFTTKKRFYRHIHNHNCAQNKLACPVEGCPRLFARPDYLREHVNTIHKKEVIPCRVEGCPKTFLSKGQEYTHHQRMHVRRHHCTYPDCEASFGKPSDLQRHVLCNHENPDFSDVLIEEEASSIELQELVDQLVTGGSKNGKRTAAAAELSSPTNVVKKKIGAMDQILTQSHASADNIPRIVFSNVPMHDQLVFVEMLRNSPLHATVILDKSNIEEATHIITFVEDPSTMRTPSFLYAINDSKMHIVNANWIADSIANGR
ncbi:predicted protein [Lichtheimia corymbifera JMRC:FSU:9682]|uniref:Uncharacterized protein n=1 Tax=Lichtheimia corymbifera JMRC:FSU:9682 TaxID=1263082 RepID=A0A068RUX2_9FUNG|nr:predicted protein [Lichtheimia corymbifera JMRC:FSU:9682]